MTLGEFRGGSHDGERWEIAGTLAVVPMLRGQERVVEYYQSTGEVTADGRRVYALHDTWDFDWV